MELGFQSTLMFVVGIFVFRPVFGLFAIQVFLFVFSLRHRIWRGFALEVVVAAFLAALFVTKIPGLGTHNDLPAYLQVFESYTANIVFSYTRATAAFGAAEPLFAFGTYLLQMITGNAYVTMFSWIFFSLLVLFTGLIRVSGRWGYLSIFFMLGNVNLFVIYGSAVRQSLALGLFVWTIHGCLNGVSLKRRVFPWLTGVASHLSLILLGPILFRHVARNDRKIVGISIIGMSFIFLIPFPQVLNSLVGYFFGGRYVYILSYARILSISYIFSAFILFVQYQATVAGKNPLPRDVYLFNISASVFAIITITAALYFNRLYPYLLVTTCVQLAFIGQAIVKDLKGLGEKIIFVSISIVQAGFFWRGFLFKKGNRFLYPELNKTININLIEFINDFTEYIS